MSDLYTLSKAMRDAQRAFFSTADVRNRPVTERELAQAEAAFDKAIAALRASREAVMSEWQPIAIAPKVHEGRDKHELSFGPMILLASVYGHIAVGYWNKDKFGNEGWFNPHDHTLMRYYSDFTHWLPIPELPR